MFSLENQIEMATKSLMTKWHDRIADVEAVRRSEGRSFSESEACRLAMVLESADQAYNARLQRLYGRVDEATQTTNVEQGLKLHTFDVITGVFPNLIAEDLVAIQPLNSKVGQIFFLKYVRGSNRGKLKKGSVLFDQFYTAGYEGSNYTSQLVEEEPHEDIKNGSTNYAISLECTPVIPGTLDMTIDVIHLKDEAKDGTLSGSGYTGTIDYATGRVELTFTDPGADKAVVVNYEYDLSYAPADAPEIELQINSSFITARPRKLKALFSMDAAYDIQMSQGINIAESLLIAGANELKHETDGDIIMDIMRQTTKTSTWTDDYVAADAGITRRDFAMTFIDEIHAQCSSIFQDTKRVRGNWVVCGKKAQDLLNIVGAPRFVGSGYHSAGPHFAGTLDGQIRVYFDPFLGEDQYLIGYKGDTLIDTGYIYAPYLLFYSTDLVMLEDFMGRRGFATSYGKRMIEPNLYRKGTIIQG